MNKISILYFQGCPNHQPAVELVRTLVGESSGDVSVEEVEVTSQEQADRLRFLGSPSIHIDGVDIDPSARDRFQYGFSCRMYGSSGLPSRELVVEALNATSPLASSAVVLPVTADCCKPADGATSGERNTLFAALGSVVAAVVASACCWLPLLLLTFGVSAAGVSSAFAAVRPYFLSLAAVLLGAGFYYSYFRKADCEPDSECAMPSSKLVRFNRSMLWVATVAVIGFGLFPNYFGVLAGSTGSANKFKGPQITLAIEGMDCEACSIGIAASLKTVPGVIDASVDYQESRATVVYDEHSPPSTNALTQAVHEAGFDATKFPH